MASYSIWVLPKGRLAHQLTTEIRTLISSRVANAPHFAPHVTIIGGVEAESERHMLATAHILAEKLRPYDILFDKVSYGDIFHQTVYILCQKTAETMAAGALARQLYNMDPSQPYMPHLSLLYADISKEDRQQIAEEEQKKLFGDENNLEEKGFQVDALQVWYTPVEDKSLSSWKLVAEIPLSSKS